MAIASVQDWFKAGKPYKQGVELFHSLSDNEALIELFELDDDDYNKERLAKELSVWNGPERPVKIEIESAGTFKSVSEIKKQKWDSIVNVPQEIRDLRIRVGQLSDKIKFNRARLEEAASDEIRHELSKIIVPAAKERQHLIYEIDYFQDHGKLPDRVPEKIAKPTVASVELFKEYKNLASRISKAKKKQQLDKAAELEAQRLKIKEVLDL